MVRVDFVMGRDPIFEMIGWPKTLYNVPNGSAWLGQDHRLTLSTMTRSVSTDGVGHRSVTDTRSANAFRAFRWRSVSAVMRYRPTKHASEGRTAHTPSKLRRNCGPAIKPNRFVIRFCIPRNFPIPANPPETRHRQRVVAEDDSVMPRQKHLPVRRSDPTEQDAHDVAENRVCNNACEIPNMNAVTNTGPHRRLLVYAGNPRDETTAESELLHKSGDHRHSTTHRQTRLPEAMLTRKVASLSMGLRAERVEFPDHHRELHVERMQHHGRARDTNAQTSHVHASSTSNSCEGRRGRSFIAIISRCEIECRTVARNTSFDISREWFCRASPVTAIFPKNNARESPSRNRTRPSGVVGPLPRHATGWRITTEFPLVAVAERTDSDSN